MFWGKLLSSPIRAVSFESHLESSFISLLSGPARLKEKEVKSLSASQFSIDDLRK
jgi:hypothetical protein